MADKEYIHVLRRYDGHRQAWFYLYRFPYNRKVQKRLMKDIQPPGERFWYPVTKAWHIAQRHSWAAQKIIMGGTHLEMCPECQRGEWCEAWHHLDPPYKRPEPHRETEEEKERAQAKYQEAQRRRSEARGATSGRAKAAEEQQARARGFRTGQQAARDFWRRQQQAEEQADASWEEARRRAGRASSEREFWETLFGAFGVDPNGVFNAEDIRRAQQPPPAEGRWDDPPRRIDTRWCMKVLGISVMPTREELKKLWRELAKEFHPDVGESGDHHKMALINRAKDYLEDYLS